MTGPTGNAAAGVGKSDPTDAETATPKIRGGIVEAIRVLRVARSGAFKARTQAANQLRDLLVTAPAELRAQLYPLPTAQRVDQLTTQQPPAGADPAAATRRPLWSLARRYQTLTAHLPVNCGRRIPTVRPQRPT